MDTSSIKSDSFQQAMFDYQRIHIMFFFDKDLTFGMCLDMDISWRFSGNVVWIFYENNVLKKDFLGVWVQTSELLGTAF